jgi:hypothetical protein
VAEEVVEEELLGSEELPVGLAGWGNNRSGLSPVRCSWRKMTTGKSRGSALLAGAAGRLLAQEERGDEATGNGGRSSGQRGAEQ